MDQQENINRKKTMPPIPIISDWKRIKIQPRHFRTGPWN
jgi:hypothetical protein